MKLNGFLALGIVLMLLGGFSMLDIADVTPPEYSLDRASPEEGQYYVTFGMARIECLDSESGIKDAKFIITQNNDVIVYPLTYHSYREDAGKIWEMWRGFVESGISQPGDYDYYFSIENNVGLKTQTNTMTFTIGPTPPQEQHYGNLSVIGRYDTEAVVFEGWYEYEDVYPIYASEHRTISSEGYTWTDLEAGIYSVHGIYQDILTVNYAVVEPEETTDIQLNFGGPEQPPTTHYTPPSTAPSEPFDVTLLFFGVGGLAVFYGFIKQKKEKT